MHLAFTGFRGWGEVNKRLASYSDGLLSPSFRASRTIVIDSLSPVCLAELRHKQDLDADSLFHHVRRLRRWCTSLFGSMAEDHSNLISNGSCVGWNGSGHRFQSVRSVKYQQVPNEWIASPPANEVPPLGGQPLCKWRRKKTQAVPSGNAVPNTDSSGPRRLLEHPVKRERERERKKKEREKKRASFIGTVRSHESGQWSMMNLEARFGIHLVGNPSVSAVSCGSQYS